MASKNTELNKEVDDKKWREEVKAFLDDIEEVSKKHKKRMAPVLDYGSNGVFPKFTVQDVVEVQKAEKAPDTNDKGTA